MNTNLPTPATEPDRENLNADAERRRKNLERTHRYRQTERYKITSAISRKKYAETHKEHLKAAKRAWWKRTQTERAEKRSKWKKKRGDAYAKVHRANVKRDVKRCQSNGICPRCRGSLQGQTIVCPECWKTEGRHIMRALTISDNEAGVGVNQP